MRIKLLLFIFLLITSGLRAQLHASFLFNSGSSQLDAGALESLKSFIAKVNPHHSCQIYIEGHTDSVANYQYNYTLSFHRAKTVEQAFIRAGIPAAWLSATGYGNLYPVAPNSTGEGRAKNRRVEVYIQEADSSFRPRLVETVIGFINQKERARIGGDLIIEDSAGNIVYAGKSTAAEPYQHLWLNLYSNYKVRIVAEGQEPSVDYLRPYIPLSEQPSSDSLLLEYFTRKSKPDAGNTSRIFNLDNNMELSMANQVDAFIKDPKYYYIFKLLRLNPPMQNMPLGLLYRATAEKVKSLTTAYKNKSEIYYSTEIAVMPGQQPKNLLLVEKVLRQ